MKISVQNSVNNCFTVDLLIHLCISVGFKTDENFLCLTLKFNNNNNDIWMVRCWKLFFISLGYWLIDFNGMSTLLGLFYA